ncbi:hypothetical protein DL764_007832 [Monosporascus ibericus]|uniref:Uncharacterized protein n=1 Tax=Monosporascus ibericus TaxID=155417 RepID=A0A4Q4SZ55_9PEZI|nr:hypothetical protein DL764_007832 [Monosporascus ibericus]
MVGWDESADIPCQPPDVRYSQGKKDMEDSLKFPWEYAVPNNKFWHDISFCAARNFLQSFSPEEIDQLPIDPESTLEKRAKIELLAKLLRELFKKREAEAAPKTYYDADFVGWDNLWLAIYTMQDELGDPEAEKTLRMLYDRRKDKTNLSHQHTLAGLLLNRGKYPESEEMEKEVKTWLDDRLGMESPQALSARRIIAQALWKQGLSRRSEADGAISDLMSIIDGMAGGRYAVYQEEERKLTNEMVHELEEESKRLPDTVHKGTTN